MIGPVASTFIASPKQSKVKEEGYNTFALEELRQKSLSPFVLPWSMNCNDPQSLGAIPSTRIWNERDRRDLLKPAVVAFDGPY